VPVANRVAFSRYVQVLQRRAIRGNAVMPAATALAKHPGRNLYGSTSPLLLETAPTHRMPLLDEHLVHRNGTTEPWVPRITDFS
jgi:hypothetical protein